jgi:ethanolamine utilization microcompartment shell protein EutL
MGDIIARMISADNATALSDMLVYVTVEDNGSDVYPIDMANRQIKNIRITTADADPKEVTVSNVPAGDAEIFLELTYTNAAAIAYTMSAGSTLIWLTGSEPALVAGKTYRMAFFRKTGTTVWHGNSVGGW